MANRQHAFLHNVSAWKKCKYQMRFIRRCHVVTDYDKRTKCKGAWMLPRMVYEVPRFRTLYVVKDDHMLRYRYRYAKEQIM